MKKITQQQKRVRKDEVLRIIPLGGCEEVGRNMTVFEYGQDIVILDMGIQFPEEDMLGINYVIPDIKYLRGKERQIRGVIFSHGHLDHIGAAPLLLPKLGNPPIIARPLTIEMIRHRQEDHSKGSSKTLKATYVKNLSQKIQLGAFTIGFFQVDHAIMDAMGITLHTPEATIIHPGDWMIEHRPVDRQEITYEHLSKLQKPTILMLESIGSTNTKQPVSEEQMLKNLKKLIDEATGRVIIATFSSQLQRVRQILEYASKVGKKVALDGFSMKMNVEIAKRLGYIKVNRSVVIPINKIGDYPEQKVIVLCTGAQGEEGAVLPRIVSGDHKYITLQRKDTVIFSSSVIPGNERTVQHLKDKLYRLSDNIVHSEIMDVHASGHSNIWDIQNIIKQIKPTYFIPVYANHFMLKEGAKLAVLAGMPKENILVPDNGSVIEVTKRTMKLLKEKASSDDVFVDGLGVGDIGEVVLRDRQMLSQEGMFVIVAIVDSKTGNVRGSPDIISRGFVYLRESKDLLAQTRRKVIHIINKAAGSEKPVNWTYVKSEIRNKIGSFLHTKTERRPVILPVIIEV